MKKLLAALLLSLPFGALADSATSTAPKTQEPQPTEELKVMTERLGLTEAQQDQIAPILVAEAKDRKSVDGNKSLNPQQKLMQDEMIHRATLQQIKTVFTPAQQAQIEQGQDHPSPGPTHP